MRTAGLPTFRKLWGSLNTTVNAGTYVVLIQNNYNSGSFQGTKTFVMSTTGPFGGKNTFLSISYLVVGCVCVLISILFWIKKIAMEKKKNT